MSSEPNYKVMELETKLEESKDEVIRIQKVLIEKLQNEVTYLKELLEPKERDAGSHMIAPANFSIKPRVRTMSEVSTMLEKRSFNASSAVKSAEEIQNENGREDI